MMDFQTIRMNIYKRFITLGGTFDDNKFFSGIGATKNSYPIRRVFSELMQLRATNREEYLQTLKVLLLDGYHIYEHINVGMNEEMDGIDEILDIFAKIFDEMSVINFVEGEIAQLPGADLKEVIENSKSIEELDNNLSHTSLMYSLKGFIISTIFTTYLHLHNFNPLEEAHFEALGAPDKMFMFAKYFTKEEFNSVVFQMMNNYIVKNPAKQSTYLHQMFLYCLIDLEMDAESATKEAYELHLYFIKNFSYKMSDIYYYAISKYIYYGLMHENTRGDLDEEGIKLLKMIEDSSTTIEMIKTALTPHVNNEFELPVLFQALEYYGNSDMTIEFIDLVQPRMDAYDARFKYLLEPSEGLKM
jgi:uncharacterized membrane protein